MSLIMLFEAFRVLLVPLLALFPFWNVVILLMVESQSVCIAFADASEQMLYKA